MKHPLFSLVYVVAGDVSNDENEAQNNKRSYQLHGNAKRPCAQLLGDPLLCGCGRDIDVDFILAGLIPAAVLHI